MHIYIYFFKHNLHTLCAVGSKLFQGPGPWGGFSRRGWFVPRAHLKKKNVFLYLICNCSKLKKLLKISNRSPPLNDTWIRTFHIPSSTNGLCIFMARILTLLLKFWNANNDSFLKWEFFSVLDFRNLSALVPRFS